MEGRFRISKTGIRQLALYECRNQLLRYAFILFAVIVFSVIKKDSQRALTINIVITGGLLVFVFGFIAVLYYRFYTHLYSAYTIEVYNNGIKKMIDASQTEKAKGIIRILLTVRISVHQNSEMFIYFRNVSALQTHKLGFIMVSDEPSEKIFIPFEIDNFEWIKHLILERTNI